MEMRKDFIPNKLSFDTKAFMYRVHKIVDMNLDVLSNKLQQIVIHEIWENGNGSKIMRIDACAQVKETKRTTIKNRIHLAVGIDLKELKSKREDLFVRVSVVLHGNLGSGPLLTKPGKDTWKKNVTNKGPSCAKTVWMLPGEGESGAQGFVQIDVMGDILRGVSENTEKKIKKSVEDFIDKVNHDLNTTNFSSYIKVEKG